MQAEAQRIQDCLLQRRHHVALDFLIVDDGSTSQDAEEIARRFHFSYLRNERRRGVGYSIRRGYDFGLEKDYGILMTMAGNNKDNPEELDRLLDPIVQDKADFIQGSRYLSGGNFGNMPFYRFVTTRYIHPLLFSLAAGKRITDSTNGFRAIRDSLLRDPALDWHAPWLDQYELEPYIFCKAIRLKYRVSEVPVTKIYPDKKLGYSKMKPVVGWWSILKPLIYLLLGIRR